MSPVGKLNSAVGAPLIHFWGRLRTVANGGSQAEEQLFLHPKCRTLVRTFIDSDQSYLLPQSPSSLTGLNRVERTARRLREIMQDQVNIGCEESSLAFFVQKFGEETAVGPDLFRSQDDAASVANGSQNWNAIYTAKAEDGPLTVQSSLQAWVTLSEQLRDAFKAELQGASLTAPGSWFGDCESLHEPWQWCKPAGGSWSAMVGNARSGTEVLISGDHYVGPATTPGNLTLAAWNTRALTRNPSFAPSSNVNWASGVNASTGSHKQMVRLRMEAASSQYARVTKDIWPLDAFFGDLVILNYEMGLMTDSRFPVTTFSGGGTGNVDTEYEFCGLDGSSPILYAYNSNGELDPNLARFGPTGRKGEGRDYDERRMFNNARRLMTAHRVSDPTAPIVPWIRGADIRPSPDTVNPEPTSVDMARMVQLCASYSNCRDVILWYFDNPSIGVGNHEKMLAAVELVYPEYAWNGKFWEAA